MSETNGKVQIEKIFADIDAKLEDIISQYRSLLMMVDTNDPLRESLFAYCDELEALKHKINNTKSPLSDRIEYVGNVSVCISDLVQDVTDYKKRTEAKTMSNEVYSVLSSIEEFIHIIKPDSTAIEDEILHSPQTQNEEYFSKQQAKLKQILAGHPELG